MTLPPNDSRSDVRSDAQVSAEALKTAGQRRINILWELTQASIALGVVATVLYVAAKMALLIMDKDATLFGVASGAFVFLTSSFSLVVGFYFGRTNHQRTGGVVGNDIGR